MFVLYAFLVIVAILISSVESVPAAPDTESIVEVAVHAEVSDNNPRSRRPVDSTLPDQLVCNFQLHNHNIVFRLKRSRLLPTVTTEAREMKATDNMFDDSAVYTDSSTGAALIVRRGSTAQYSVEGSFFHDQKEWNVQPWRSGTGGTSYKNQGKSWHQIVPVKFVNTSTSFINDVLLDTQDRREELYKLMKQNRTETQQPAGGEMERRQQQHRHKRAVTRHVIEMAFIADYQDYSKWRRHVGEANVISAMRLWYTFTAESVNLRYQTIQDPDISVSTRVTVLKILTNSSEATFISDLVNADGMFQGPEALNAFRKWFPKQQDIPLSDHYMLMTGFDVMGSSGVAISSRACTEYSVSICEDSFTGQLAGVAAHELGHSLSAVHDSDTTGAPACTDRDQYIMAAVFSTPVRAGNEGNPWRFSTCSVKAIKSYLADVTCTLPEHTSGVHVLPVASEKDRAGQVLFRNAQCVLAFQDPRSSFCHSIQVRYGGGLGNLCGGMYCSLPGDPLGSCQTIVPQEYTACGDKKWCVAGHCVTMDDSTTSPTPTSVTPTAPTTDLTRPPATAAATQTTAAAPAGHSITNTESTGTTTSATFATTTTLFSTMTTTSPTSPNVAVVPTTDISTDIELGVVPTAAAATSPTPAAATITTSGLPDVSACNYLIYLRRGTQWWHCVQRALGRTEATPPAAQRRPFGRGRIYLRRYRLYF